MVSESARRPSRGIGCSGPVHLPDGPRRVVGDVPLMGRSQPPAASNCFSSRFGAWARLVAAATHVTGRSAAAISGTTYRESDGKRRPRLGRRAHLDASPMDEHDFPRDVQTQARLVDGRSWARTWTSPAKTSTRPP